MTTSTPAPRASREARFRAVYEATYDDLLRFAQRRVHPSHAEDVTAEVFLVAWRRLDDMPEGTGDARPWLFGVARATMLNHQRGDRRRDALAARLADATPRDGSSDDLAVSRLDLAAAWPRLSDAEQEVISLAVWEGSAPPRRASSSAAPRRPTACASPVPGAHCGAISTRRLSPPVPLRARTSPHRRKPSHDTARRPRDHSHLAPDGRGRPGDRPDPASPHARHTRAHPGYRP